MKTWYFILFVLILNGCRKEKMIFPDTVLEGTVIDSGSVKYVSEATVTLFREKCSSNSLSFSPGGACNDIYLKSTLSDQNGQWKIKFNAVKGRKYKLSVFKPGFFNSGTPEDDIIIDDFSKHLFVDLKQVGFIPVRINDYNQKYNNIRLWINGYENGQITQIISYESISGTMIDATVIMESWMNRTIVLKWESTFSKDTIPSFVSFADTFYVDKQTSYTINY